MSKEQPTSENQETTSGEQPQIVKIETSSVKEFSFKKMAIAWGIVIFLIVVISLAVEIAVHGW